MASGLPSKVRSFETAQEPLVTPATSSNLPGIIALSGGVLLHLVLGTIYCWGNFNSYTPAHMKNFDGTFDPKLAGQVDTLQVMPLTLVFQALSMPLGPPLFARFGPGLVALLSGILCSTGLILASFAPSLMIFVLLYAGVFGCGIGVGYTQPLVCGFKHFPNNKGAVSGIILGAFGMGGFVFNQIGSGIFNPDGLAIDPSTKLFAASVTDAFPTNLRLLGLMYLGITVVAAPMIRLPKTGARTVAAAAANSPGYTILQAITTAAFWRLWLGIALCAQGGLFVGSMYKVLALDVPALNNDRYLSMVAALGALSNGLMRPPWGALYDRFGYRSCFSAVASIQAVTIFLLPRLQSPALYLVGVMCSWGALAGCYAMAPAEVTKLFGNPAVYSVMFTAFAFAGLFGVKICQFIAQSTSIDVAFLYLCATSITAFALVQCHGAPPALIRQEPPASAP